MKIFVPGRICLFGEHTDWAGGYRRINADLEKGYCIITGTNQGLYADVKPHPTHLRLRATLEDGSKKGFYEIPMERDILRKEAEKGEFFSYACGVAYQVLTHYRVQGLEIDNYLTDLPIKKGLSSSAAVCVLTSRAFNRIYDLKMTTRGEMEYAYAGEITTPSRCGRMDQGCAYGEKATLMTFDGDLLDVDELNVGKDLHFVIVDLKAEKDTKEILHKLNQAFPFADNAQEQNVQKYLGKISAGITHDAIQALISGNAKEVGKLMTFAQQQFDENLMPACPSQLTAPVLHQVLNYEPLKKYIYGGKGVGSQGDGTAQFIVPDEQAQDEVIRIIERDLKMECLKLTIPAGKKLKKAVIPAAGFGTRLFPATKGLKKEFFPIVDNEGRVKPVILIIVEEALKAGIDEVAIIIQKEDQHIFEEYFHRPPAVAHYNKLSKENKAYSDYLLEVGRKITFLPQETQEGFGHAVYCANEWVGDEAFLLLLGDHLYASNNEISCSGQLVQLYEKSRKSVVGLKETHVSEIHHFGCASGVWQKKGSTLSITELYEKPNAEYAAEHLRVEGLSDDTYLSFMGQYILTSKIFELLEENIKTGNRERGEFQLTSCLDQIRREEGMTGYIVAGQRFDIGMPEEYRQTVIDFRNV